MSTLLYNAYRVKWSKKGEEGGQNSEEKKLHGGFWMTHKQGFTKLLYCPFCCKPQWSKNRNDSANENIYYGYYY